MQSGVRTRLIIYEILYELKKNMSNYDEIFENKLKKQPLSQRDKNMVHTVVLGSMRYHPYIFKFIKNYINKKISEKNYLLLLSAITQIVYLNFKEYAVVNTTVELAKNKKVSAYPGFINAVLKKIIIDKNLLKNTNISFNELPKWFIMQTKNWKSETKKNFLENITETPDLHLVFKNNIFLEKFDCQGIKSSDKSISINNSKMIIDLPNFNIGQWWIQDLASMLPIHLIKNIKDKKILDMCAAPGGKSFQILSTNSNLTMVDINKKKCEILKKNLLRLRFNNNIINKDVLKINEINKYDLILLDAPCSAVGTIRRNPEIFFREKEINMNIITLLQKSLLNKAKKLLNKNGYIVYMVCSFLEIETTSQINLFLEKNKDFQIEKFSSEDRELSTMIDQRGFINVLPSKVKKINHDGFFAVKIKKYA